MRNVIAGGRLVSAVFIDEDFNNNNQNNNQNINSINSPSTSVLLVCEEKSPLLEFTRSLSHTLNHKHLPTHTHHTHTHTHTHTHLLFVAKWYMSVQTARLKNSFSGLSHTC